MSYPIEIGRRVRFFAGYGGTDGTGSIVAIIGEVNHEPRQATGVLRVIRPNDCKCIIILDDGRKFSDVHQCGIDMPGIGFRTLDEVDANPGRLYDVHAAYEARSAIDAANKRAAFELAERSRVIVDPPLFYYNGIKDEKGGKLQKCHYSTGDLISYPAGTISIYARGYDRFSDKVRACFAVQNDTDTMVDYFDKDTIRVIPSHPLYAAVKAAADKQAARRA